MKQFQFRLDSVLRLRETRLEAERRMLQQIVAEQRRLKQALEHLGEERANAGKFLQRAPGGAGSVELRALSGFLLGLRARGTAIRERMETAENVAVQQRKRVLAAEQAVRLLVKMRERRMAEWRQEWDRELERVAQEAWNAAHFRERKPAEV
ncbi:MAG: flagellar export protein FliJ [Bryobacteraceae bacterium]